MPVTYSTDLKYLFEANGASQAPYNVDPVLFRIISASGFNDTVAISSYFKEINSADIQMENHDSVRRFIGQLLPGETAVDPNAPLPAKSYSFNSDASSSDIFVNFGRNTASGLSPQAFQTILKDVITIHTPITNNATDLTTTDHTAFRAFIYEIMDDVTRYFFNAAKQKLGEFVYGLPDSDSRQILYDPVMRLYNIKTTRLSGVITSLRDACTKSMADIFESFPISSADMLSFKPGAYTSKFYYNLRTRMVDSIDVKTIYTNIEIDQVIYFKKVIVDLFLKSCSPMVHILFMQSMMQYYVNRGDYVNVRVIMLAMVFYVFYTLKAFTELNNTMPADSQISATQAASMNVILNKFVTYLNNNTKVNVDSPDSTNDGLKQLVFDLHSLSEGVSSQNGTIQALVKQIADNQLAMRNVLFNIEVERKEYKKATWEFWIVLSVLVGMVIANTVLFVMGKPEFAFYLSGFLAGAVIVFKIVLMVMAFVTKKRA